MWGACCKLDGRAIPRTTTCRKTVAIAFSSRTPSNSGLLYQINLTTADLCCFACTITWNKECHHKYTLRHYCKSFPWSTSTKKIKNTLGCVFSGFSGVLVGFFYVTSQTFFIQLMLVFSYFFSVLTKPTFSLQEIEAGFSWLQNFQAGFSWLQNALHTLKVSSDSRGSLKHKPLFSPLTF